MPQSEETRRFYPARLVARNDAGGAMTRVTIDIAPETAATYTSAGQYVEVRVEEATGFFVLANEPGAATWELVMRSGGGASDVLLASPTGASLAVTGAIGVGFPLDEVRGNPLVIVLGGTGIAAGRPLLGRRIAEGDAVCTHVFIGVRTRAEFGMQGDVRAWHDAGVNVRVCLSHEDGPIEGIPYANGYVQDVLRASSGAISGTRIVAVGAGSMIDALRKLAPELGLTPDKIYTNH